MHKLYEDFINAYLFGRKEQVFSIGTNIVSECKENPFPEGTEEREAFFQAMRNYRLWTSGAINSRVSGRRLAKYLEILAGIGAPNPFPEKKEISQNDVKPQEIKTEKAEVKTDEQIPVLHVTGDIPTQNSAFTKETEHVPQEEKKPLFSRHKRR